MKTSEVAPMPFWTPATRTPTTTSHTSASGTRMPGTTSSWIPGSPAWRNSPKKNASGSSPQEDPSENSA